MNNIGSFIFGKFSAQLADVFGQIDKFKRPLASGDDVLNLWQTGITTTAICETTGLPRSKVIRIVEEARCNGDPRAVHRAGWAKGKVPGKPPKVKI